MGFRVDVTADCKIEIFRMAENKESNCVTFGDLEDALAVIVLLLQQDLEQAHKDRFIPQIIREAPKAFRELEAQSPYAPKRKNRKT
jgi:hypothetical protein